MRGASRRKITKEVSGESTRVRRFNHRNGGVDVSSTSFKLVKSKNERNEKCERNVFEGISATVLTAAERKTCATTMTRATGTRGHVFQNIILRRRLPTRIIIILCKHVCRNGSDRGEQRCSTRSCLTLANVYLPCASLVP